MIKAVKAYFAVFACALIFAVSVFFIFPSGPASALGLFQPIGGQFQPGAFDIFTPVPLCGNTVTVVTPLGIPIVLVWIAPIIYRDFAGTPVHIDTNMLGLILPNPNPLCPLPILYMFGSSLTPSF